MTATVTSDFREEFEAERLRWLRRRFLWYTGINGALGVLGTAAVFLVVVQLPRDALGLLTASVLLNLIGTTLYASLFFYVRSAHRPFSRERLVRFVFWLIVVNGVIQLPASIIGNRMSEIIRTQQTAAISDQPAAPAASDPVARPSDRADVERAAAEPAGAPPAIRLGAQWLAGVFVAHLLASLFIPWTPREAVRPLIPLLALYGVITLIISDAPFLWRLVWIAGSPLIGVPGVLWSMWRASRFRDRFHSRVLRRSYREMKRELVDARRIHEDLFPRPILDGPVRFVYRYEPMRQIGGDFLYAHRFPGVEGDGAGEPVSVVIIDVTGHGIPAALTVNRLYGELERLFAEEPDIRPGDVLTALNSYVHYTLATHSVYATALCLRADPGLDLLEWASGGHPPAFLRTVDGRLERLDSTSFVLGACYGEEFDDGQRATPFARGDTLIAYTDGAIEARDAAGRMVGIDGFQRWVASLRPDPGADSGWASALLRTVEEHRFGPPADDTLIVELYRPLRDQS
ncbi:MAG: serine/threonine-protein phosphatase [Planctomycetota bacterium]|nr:MAG: serine/threonine-protein phosphatase [Planctomycetota bacterium]